MCKSISNQEKWRAMMLFSSVHTSSLEAQEHQGFYSWAGLSIAWDPRLLQPVEVARLPSSTASMKRSSFFSQISKCYGPLIFDGPKTNPKMLWTIDSLWAHKLMALHIPFFKILLVGPIRWMIWTSLCHQNLTQPILEFALDLFGFRSGWVMFRFRIPESSPST